jgi:PAS domain S-box-containing protein
MKLDDNFSTPSSTQAYNLAACQDDARYLVFVENAIEAIWRIDFHPPIHLDTPLSEQVQAIFDNGIYSEANDSVVAIYGLTSKDDVIGKTVENFMDRTDPKNIKNMEELVLNRYYIKNLVTYEQDTMGSTRCIVNNITPGIQGNAVQYVWGASLDITEVLDLREKLDNTRDELDQQKKSLEEKNAALKELITHIELDKKEYKERIIANIDKVILPALDKLNVHHMENGYINQVRQSLENLASSFGQNISDRRVNLTPREIEVCNLVKNGLSNKEIARMLKIALHTVEKHRRTVRKKLGITSQGINLQTHLNSL